MKICLKNIMKSGKKSTTSSKKEFDSKPVYNEKYNNGKINKNFSQ